MTSGARGVLWLHVGTHKTGTTSIQKSVESRRQVLAQHGVATHDQTNSWKLAHAFLRPSLVTNPRLKGHPLPDLSTIIGAVTELDMMRGSHPSMVLSAEAFCFFRQPLEAFALMSVLSARFAKVVPIMVFRNLADWRMSLSDQLEKTGVWDAQKQLPDERSAAGEWYFDQEAIHAFWCQFGEPIVIDYDKMVAAESSILPAFARAIGQAHLFQGLDVWKNPSRWRVA